MWSVHNSSPSSGRGQRCERLRSALDRRLQRGHTDTPAGARGSGFPSRAGGNQTSPPAASGGACLPPAPRPDRATPARREASGPPDLKITRHHAEYVPKLCRSADTYPAPALVSGVPGPRALVALRIRRSFDTADDGSAAPATASPHSVRNTVEGSAERYETSEGVIAAQRTFHNPRQPALLIS